MEGTRIALLIVEKSREVTSCCSNPASTSQLERVLLAPQAKANHPIISSQYSPQNTNSNSLQMPNSNLLDLMEWDPFIGLRKAHESASLHVISVLHLIVQSSTW